MPATIPTIPLFRRFSDMRRLRHTDADFVTSSGQSAQEHLRMHVCELASPGGVAATSSAAP